MIDLRPALAIAKQYRTCPPLRVLEDPAASAFAQEHLSVCPYCKTQCGVEKEWAELADSLQDQFPAPALEKEIRPGQIRFVHSQMAVWRGGFYYNPPGVLVLEKAVGVPDGYRVAQIYHDVSLAAPGDLVVDDGRTGAGDLMIECWNTYSMKGSYLGPAVGRLSDEALDGVMQMEKDVQAVPVWAVKPLPLEEHDVRLYFRELEVEVGFVFASAAAAEIMDEMDRPRLAYVSLEEMKHQLSRRFSRLSLPDHFETQEEGLAAASLPAEDYAIAAADDEWEVLPANYVLIQSELVKDIQPIHVETLPSVLSQGSLTIGGRIIGLPPEQGESRLLAFLVRQEKPMLAAATAKFDYGSGHFTTTFKTAGESGGDLKIAVFCYIDDD